MKFVQEHPYPQTLSSEYDRCCPCSMVHVDLDDGNWVEFETYCWRVSKASEWQDLYVQGTLPKDDLRRLAVVLRRTLTEQEWYNPYIVRGIKHIDLAPEAPYEREKDAETVQESEEN